MKYFALILVVALISCTKNQKATEAESSPAVVEEKKPFVPKVPCQTSCEEFDKTVCTKLFSEYEVCNGKKSESSCKGFLSAFAHSLPHTVKCTNTCSEGSFQSPIVHRCDEIDESGYPKITERASQLLAKLKHREARDLFLSKDFRSILDGHIAEEILPEIEKVRAARGK